MANLRKSLEAAVAQDGETIEAIVVDKHYSMQWAEPAGSDENVLLPVEAGLAKLDADYDDGYGGADCFPFYAWTKSKVWFVSEYDGATGIAWLPRHPIELFGGIPAGNLFGMPVLIDPRMPNDRIKIVYRDGREHDLPFP